MAERNLAIRLTVLDGGKVKAELREVGETGEKSLKKIELAGQPASKSLLALNAAANDVKGSVVGLTGNLGPLGSALGAIGPVGLAVGAALAVVTLGLKAAFEHAAEAEQSMGRLQAVLRATGNTTGLSGKQIAAFADQIESSTLATAEQVQDAAGVMATFRSVTGETFTRAMRLAQDMSAVFGTDLRGSVTQLGKALENPAEGLTALRRIGILFTDSQKELIQSLVDMGKQAEAQKVILDVLESKVGGAGAGEATGLTGATNRLSDAWGNLLEDIGQTRVIAGAAEGALSGLSYVVEGLRNLMKDDPIGKQLMDAQQDLAEQEERLKRIQDYKPITPFTDMSPMIERQEARVEKIREEVNKLAAQARQEAQEYEAEQKKLQAAQEQAARDRRADLLSEQRKKLDDAVDKLATDPADRIARVNKDLETTRTRIEALREKDGSNAGAVDAALKQAEELARRQIDAIEKPAREAATRVMEANTKVVEDLQRQMLGLADKRQAFIEQAVGRLSSDAQRDQTRKLAAQLFDSQAYSEAQKVVEDLNKQLERLTDKRSAFIQDAAHRLSDNATSAQRAEVEKLAAALYDQGEAQQKLNKLKQEGEQVTGATRTATESYAAELERLKNMLDAGAISQDTYNRAVANAEKQQLDARKDAEAGALRAFRNYREQAEDAASAVEKAFTEGMKATEDAIVDFVTSGGKSLQSLGDLANSIVADITRMAVQKSVTGPLFDMLGSSLGGSGGGFLDSIFGSIFHEGGEVGGSAPTRRLPAYVYASAPRYHTGGVAGLKPGEIPAILERGEVVLPKDGTRMGSPVNVVMNISTPDASSFRKSQSQIAAEAARGIQHATRNL
ncbi:MAG: phage tail length tape measure family protein [Alphaproteobacteria bacterium]|nr:MAG: phage tail length tape measure family protein [Alphaproteobacteria bacterium]